MEEIEVRRIKETPVVTSILLYFPPAIPAMIHQGRLIGTISNAVQLFGML